MRSLVTGAAGRYDVYEGCRAVDAKYFAVGSVSICGDATSSPNTVGDAVSHIEFCLPTGTLARVQDRTHVCLGQSAR